LWHIVWIYNSKQQAKKMKKTIPFLLVIFAAFHTAAQKQSTRSTIVIIPGSWSAAADWGFVAPKLIAAGYEVIVVNLPGHGSDKTAIPAITFQGYVDVVKKAIGDRTNITLVAHSFGGVVMNQVAEEMHDRIKELVYVAAYVPRNGESLLSLATTDGDSHLGKVLQIKEKEGLAIVPKEGVVDAFFEDAPTRVQEFAPSHFPVEPLAPLATPVRTTDANYGALKKVYVFTANDHTNSPTLQHKMVADNNITKSYTLPSSHTPFVSMPDALAGIIANEAK
jgi:pimeloyl-ACP methyl ester carboxylesterase